MIVQKAVGFALLYDETKDGNGRGTHYVPYEVLYTCHQYGYSECSFYGQRCCVCRHSTSLCSGNSFDRVYGQDTVCSGAEYGDQCFFAYTLVQGMGYSWKTALAVLFVEGIIFILLAVSNQRERIVHNIPLCLRYALSIGIGMCIAFIGMKNAGSIIADPVTFVAWGKFIPASLLANAGIMLSGILMIKKVKGVLFYSISMYAGWGSIRGNEHSATLFAGIDASFAGPYIPEIRFCTLVFLCYDYLCFCTCFYGCIQYDRYFNRSYSPNGFDSRRRNIPHIKQALQADVIRTTIGATLETSTVTTYAESAAGITEA